MGGDVLRLRVAVPTEGPGGIDAPRSAHFGRAASFTLLDVESGAPVEAGVIANPAQGHGGCATTVALLAQAAVDAVIVAGIGSGALDAVRGQGMSVLFDGTSSTPRASAQAYIEGGLSDLGEGDAHPGH